MSKHLKRVTLAFVAVLCASSLIQVAQADSISGAGSTFIYPLLSKWSEAYRLKTGNDLEYQSIGSGGGIKQIQAKAVDFGVTDCPLSRQDLDATDMVQFPVIIGGVVPVVNIHGIRPGQLRLSGEILSDIFQGTVTKWDDRRIKLLNPRLKMPAGEIATVVRADASGTTAIFTNYLAKVSGTWKGAAGFGANFKWPVDMTMSGKGNEGVAESVARNKNSIGYVEYSYAMTNKMSYVQLKNASGNFVQPSPASFSAASIGTDWSQFPGMSTFITNSPGINAWPITGAAFVITPKNPENKVAAAKVLMFFNFAFENGKGMATDLGYVPMPDITINYIRDNIWPTVATD